MILPTQSGPGQGIPGEFWKHKSVEELIKEQEVLPVLRLEDIMGGWPEDELDDGFEIAYRAWR